MTARTMKVGLLTAVVGLLAMAGCVPGMPGAPTTPAIQPPLDDTEWSLVALGQTDNVHPALKGKEVRLVFSGDTQITGNAGCNGYGGSCTVEPDGTLGISDLIHTEMYCVEPGVMDQEQFFLDALASAETYEVVDEELRISGGGKTLVFVKD